MFRAYTVRDVAIEQKAEYTAALLDKLVDIERNRIGSTDELVMRKAVLGLLEVVSRLERRVAELEGEPARSHWTEQLAAELGVALPDHALRDDKQTVSDL